MSKKGKAIIGALVLGTILGCSPVNHQPPPAVPQTIPCPQVPTPAPEAPEEIIANPVRTRPSYQQYAYLLQLCVDKDGIDFAKLRPRKKQLTTLLQVLGRLDRDKYQHWSKVDQTAFWINVYNMQTLRIVLENYPLRGSRWLNPIYGPNSLRHIKGIKTDYKFLVMDEEFTLAELERRYFRTPDADPRCLFALSQLSQSSPPLQKEPYEGQRLSEQLDQQIRTFLGSPTGFRIDRQKKRVYLSSLFKTTWYGEYITGHFAIDRKFKDHPPCVRAVLHFISLYVNPADKAFLEIENYAVHFMKYNWTLCADVQRP